MSYTDNISMASQPIADNGAYTQRPDQLRLRDFIKTDIARRACLVLIASIIFTVIVLSFRPFSANSANPVTSSGDIVNQIGFLALLAISSFIVLTQVSSRLLRTAASPVWLFAFAAMALAIYISDDSASAIRALALALISAFVVLSIIIVPASRSDFRLVLILSSITIIAISYAGIVLFPDASIHSASGLEAQHAGLWRGPFQHKNVAGPVFTIFTIIGLYIYRSGNKAIGIIIAILSFIFVLKTGSKTTAGFLPLAIFAVLITRLFNSPKAAIWMVAITLLAAGLLSVGAVYSEGLRSITHAILDDTTYTGRDDLWHFGIDNILMRPFLGFGFDNFWLTDFVMDNPLPDYSKWDVRGIGNGHNSYIDTFLAFGFVGAPIILFTVYILPMINYVRIYKDKNKRLLADMFMMIIAFTVLLSLMETFVLSRSNPIWILHMFAVLGLQVLAGMDKQTLQNWFK